jgi:hypothetical protein
MIRLSIGHPAQVIGMDSASMIVGRVWRNGGIVYALRGVAGVWPNAPSSPAAKQSGAKKG